MKKIVLAALAASAAMSAATAAHAATTTVTFSMLNGVVPVANGSFSFDTSKTGQLTYSDLNTFSYTVPNGTYDLAFTQSGNFSQYYYFGYNATSQSFVSVDIGGFPQILSAIKSDFGSGYFARFDNAFKVVRNYGPDSGNVAYTTLETSTITTGAVPEPATWAMMIGGFGLVGFAMRRRNAVRTTVAYA